MFPILCHCCGPHFGRSSQVRTWFLAGPIFDETSKLPSSTKPRCLTRQAYVSLVHDRHTSSTFVQAHREASIESRPRRCPRIGGDPGRSCADGDDVWAVCLQLLPRFVEIGHCESVTLVSRNLAQKTATRLQCSLSDSIFVSHPIFEIPWAGPPANQ
jgi:hypothetical protein